MSELTVGEVRATICEWAGGIVPAVETAHYVVVIHDQESGRASILTCCEDNRDSLILLHRAIEQLSAAN